MVYFQSHHGFGIQLFNYAYARCVAEHFGCQLRHHSHDGYDKISSGNQFVLSKYFDLDFNPGGKVLAGEPVKYTDRHVLKFADIDGTAPIFLQGWYERCDQISAFKQKIKAEWLRFREPNNYSFPAGDLAVHVRLGDKTQEQQTLSAAYYADAIRTINPGRIYWFTDSPGSDFIRGLRKRFGGDLISGSFMEDFKMLMKFDKLVTSASTYSFWAAWLGDASEIVVPKRGQIGYGGSWVHSAYDDCDYWPAEKRYVCLSKSAWGEMCARPLPGMGKVKRIWRRMAGR